MADGFIASTPQAESLYRSVGCARGMFIPTPYPIHMDEWNLGKPLAERMGIFVGTREFDVPSRNHWQAVALANQLSLELQVPAAVMNAAGRRGLMILTAIRETNPFLQIIVGPLGYRDYLRLMASHRCVVQLDSSAVPGQVAGDALLCRMPCVGGNGAVEKIAFPPLADCSPQEAASHVRRLMTSDEEWQSAVVASQAEANRRLSFAVVGEALQRLCEP